MILVVRNDTLRTVNAMVGDMGPGPYKEYLSADSVEKEENALNYPVEFLNTLTAGSALPDHKLRLKKGFPVMLLRKIDAKKGHVNGARYVVEKMTENLLYLRGTVGKAKGVPLCLPRMPCGPGDDRFPISGSGLGLQAVHGSKGF